MKYGTKKITKRNEILKLCVIASKAFDPQFSVDNILTVEPELYSTFSIYEYLCVDSEHQSQYFFLKLFIQSLFETDSKLI